MSVVRIQRQRTKGWRMPEGAVYVGRPTRWGNPFPWQGDQAVWLAIATGERADERGRRRAAVAWYRWWVTGMGEPMPVKAADVSSSPGELEYSDGSRRKISDVVVDLGAIMLAKQPIELPPVPDLSPLRPTTALVCWCPTPLPCHADVLIELLEAAT